MWSKEVGDSPCLFQKDNMIVSCYVDGVILFTEHEILILETLKKLSNKFRGKDVGKPTLLLGLDIT